MKLSSRRWSAALKALGFHQGSPGVLFEHLHHYRQEFDSEAAAVLEAFAWSYSPLPPEDEQ
jgi:hypothetical protein